jgi:hypothetical protein
MILLHDTCSLGYDLRDFEVALDFMNSEANEQFLIYTDERNIEIFQNSISTRQVQFKGYSKGSFSTKELSNLIRSNAIGSDAIFSFSDLCAKFPDKAKLISGSLKPSLKPYLNPPKNLVGLYKEFLNELSSCYDNRIVVFAIVSGLKPLSDVGRTPKEQKLEGGRQTYPFQEIADILKFIQDSFIQEEVVFIAISAQYGEPCSIRYLVERVSKDISLKFPIQVFEDVDWSDRPEQQAAFFRAIHERACDLRIPSVAFGNASTYQHLIIAATGGFHVSGVALDSYDKPPVRDGRPYWKDLSRGELPGLRAFQQAHDNPGNWKPVTEDMKNYLKDSILSYL